MRAEQESVGGLISATAKSLRLKSELQSQAALLESGGKGKSVSLIAIQKLYGDVVAVRDLSLDIKPGEFVTLLGPSGSGKTTTLLMIAGFAQPTRGRILLGGKDVTFDPPHKRGIGIVFQNYALFPHMTVRQNLAFPLKMRRLSGSDIEKRVAWALELVRLTGFEGRYPAQLSGGQQQRVALARALIYEPSVVLMDEPLGALDRKLRGHMQVEIKQLQQKLDLTVLYVTHDQEEALTMSDRVAVMNHGQIEQLGSPQELYEQPANQFVDEFLGESNNFQATVAEVTPTALIVTTAAGTVLHAKPIAGVRLGEQVCVSIRPERILVMDYETPSSEGIDAEVVQQIYMGDSLRFVLETERGDRVVAKATNCPPSTHLGRKRTVKIRIDRESLRVYPNRKSGMYQSADEGGWS